MARRRTSDTDLTDWVPEDADPALVDRVRSEVEALAGLDHDALRSRWRQLLRQKAPEHLRPWLLRKVLAYRIKARAFGDLDAVALKMLAEAARDARREPKSKGQGGTGSAWDVQRLRGHRPGTVFVREHGGEMHRVIQRADGFDYRGETFASLSAVAKRITGTSWNGPRFFGLREPSNVEQELRRRPAARSRAEKAGKVS